MKLRAFAALASLTTALVWMGGACNVAQPKPQCAIAHGGHAVRYTLKTGTGPCASKVGEVVGAQSYRVPEPGRLPTLALKSHTLTVLEGQDPAHSTYSMGTFTTELPGPDSFCEVPTMTEARQVVAASGTDISYQWSNVRIYDSAPIPGTQWTADLTYTESNCTATYEAVGVFPAISCVATSNNGTPVLDVALCKALYPGLSLDPAYPVRCDEASGLCVLDGTPPATN